MHLSIVEIAFILSAILSGGYLLFLFLTILFHKNNQTADTSPAEGVTIVIAAHNELHNLTAFLPFIVHQDYPLFEIIIACDRCTDGSIEYIKSIHDSRIRLIEINEVPDGFQPKKHALTKAIHQAAHPWILLTDADCAPSSQQWIISMMRAKGNKQICMGLSFITGKRSWLYTFIRFETLFTALQYAVWALRGKPYMAVGRNLLYAKQLFINNNGFGKHAAHIGGDDDLLIQSIANKHNTAVCLDSRGFTYSPSAEGFKAWWKQKHRHLHAGKQYSAWVLICLSVYPVSSILFYCLGIFYIISSEFPIAIILYILRTCIFISTFAGTGYKWKYSVYALLLPVLELNYLFYLLFAGCYNLAIPIKKWK